MTKMLLFWMTQYKLDGFGSTRPTTRMDRALSSRRFLAAARQSLRQVKPNVLMLGEEETPDLAHKPFSLDYAWRMYDPGGTGALKTAADGDASRVRPAWQSQVADFPAGMQHMSVQDDWDTPATSTRLAARQERKRLQPSTSPTPHPFDVQRHGGRQCGGRKKSARADCLEKR